MKTLRQIIDEVEKEDNVTIAYAMRKAAESMYEYLMWHEKDDMAAHDYLFKAK